MKATSLTNWLKSRNAEHKGFSLSQWNKYLRNCWSACSCNACRLIDEAKIWSWSVASSSLMNSIFLSCYTMLLIDPWVLLRNLNHFWTGPTSDLRNPLAHTEINLSILLKDRRHWMQEGWARIGMWSGINLCAQKWNLLLFEQDCSMKNCCMFSCRF